MSVAGAESTATGSRLSSHGLGFRLTAGALAERLGADLVGPPELQLERLDTIDRADERTLTFIRDARRAAAWGDSRAAAAIVTRGCEPAAHDPQRRALLVVDDADRALIAVLESFAPRHRPPLEGARTASIDPTAVLDPSVVVGPHVSIGPGSMVGAGTILHAGVRLGADVRIGEGCDLRSGAVVEDRCVLGHRILLHPNAVVGADGFGYRPEKREGDLPRLVKIPHAGHVEIGDDVEIGANASIDRGKFGATEIGAGTKIDNLVQIGHNCRIGRSCVICGAAGISGSVTLGDGVTIAGGVGIKDNVTVGPGATIGARSGVMDDIPAGEVWVGYPARPFKRTMRIIAAMQQLPDILKDLKDLKQDRRRAGEDR